MTKADKDRGCPVNQWLPLLLLLLALPPNAPAQNLFEADEDSGNIYAFTTNGVQSTFVSGLTLPTALAFDSDGDLFVLCFEGGGATSGCIEKFTPAGVPTGFFALRLDTPKGLAFDSAGNLYVTCITGQLPNPAQGQILKFTPDGTQSTFASGLSDPCGLAFDGAGNLYVTVYTNANPLKRISAGGAIIKISPGGSQTPFALTGANEYEGLVFDSSGDLFAANYSSSGSITEYPAGGSPFTWAGGLNFPLSMAFNSAGNMFVANSGNNSIIEITPGGGTQTTFASGLDFPGCLAFAPPPPLHAVSPGIQGNQFAFTLIGSNHQVAVVEACTNLAGSCWSSLATNTLTNGSSWFSDAQWTNFPARFYRLASP